MPSFIIRISPALVRCLRRDLGATLSLADLTESVNDYTMGWLYTRFLILKGVAAPVVRLIGLVEGRLGAVLVALQALERRIIKNTLRWTWSPIQVAPQLKIS